MSNNDYVLVHHGILGQKWGVRRFQNKDGTLTSEGMQRYRNSNTKEGIERDADNANTQYIALSNKINQVRSEAWNHQKNAWQEKNILKKKTEEGKARKLYAKVRDLEKESNKALAKACQLDDLVYNLNKESIAKGQKYLDKKTGEKVPYTGIYKYLVDDKDRLLYMAKKRDRYSIDFLEIAPDPIIENPKRMYKEYERFLDNPEKWMDTRNSIKDN